MKAGEQTGREEEGAPDVSRSGKDMSKCMWRSLLGSFFLQEHIKMFAWMSLSSRSSFGSFFFLICMVSLPSVSTKSLIFMINLTVIVAVNF